MFWEPIKTDCCKYLTEDVVVGLQSRQAKHSTTGYAHSTLSHQLWAASHRNSSQINMAADRRLLPYPNRLDIVANLTMRTSSLQRLRALLSITECYTWKLFNVWTGTVSRACTDGLCGIKTLRRPSFRSPQVACLGGLTHLRHGALEG